MKMQLDKKYNNQYVCLSFILEFSKYVILEHGYVFNHKHGSPVRHFFKRQYIL